MPPLYNTNDVIDLIIGGKQRGEGNAIMNADDLGNYALHSGEMIIEPTGQILATETWLTGRFDDINYYQ